MGEIDNTLLLRRLSDQLAKTDAAERSSKHGGNGGGDDMETRLAKIEVIIPTLATKADVADVRTDIHKAESSHVKWSIGIGIAVVGLIITYLNLSKAPPSTAPQPQPIVIQLPQPVVSAPPQPTALAPAPKGK